MDSAGGIEGLEGCRVCRGYRRVGRGGQCSAGGIEGLEGCRAVRWVGKGWKGWGSVPVCLLNEQLRDFSTFSTNGNAQKRSNFVVRYALEFNTKTFLKSRFQHNVK